MHDQSGHYQDGTGESVLKDSAEVVRSVSGRRTRKEPEKEAQEHNISQKCE